MKLLIVDDEKVICNGLRNLARRLDLEAITEIDTETDPLAAMDKIRESPPDILMTDVKMPGMSGLELMAAATKVAADIGFIVISGYDEFDLVREALKLHAADYLLKPATTDELRAALSRTIAAVEQSRDHERVQFALIEDTIERLVRNDVPSAHRLEIMAEAAGDMPAGRHLRMGALESRGGRTSSSPAEIVAALRARIRGMSIDVVAVDVDVDLSVILIAAAAPSGLDAAVSVISSLVGSSRKSGVVCSLSSRSHSLELLPVLYREVGAARLRKLIDPGSVYEFVESEATEQLPASAERELQRFESAVALADHTTARDLLSALPHSPWLSIPYIQRIWQALAVRSRGRLPGLESFFSVEEFVERGQRALGVDTPNEPAGGRGRERPLVEAAKQYVRADLANHGEMTLVADHIGLSYTYFSTVFKEAAGVSFSEFVRDARMNEAGRLLRTGQLSVTEVARRVGYQYPKHFARAFKQYYNTSPKTYAESTAFPSGQSNNFKRRR